VEDAALILNALAGYDKFDITSVEHAGEDYSAAMKQQVSGFRLGIPRVPFFDLIDPEIAKAVETAIAVLAKMTRGFKDVTLPSTRDINLAGENNAFHDEFLTRNPERYQVSTRRMLQANVNRKASDYVQSRWRLDLLRRTIDDAFTDFDLVALPTRRRMSRKIDAALKRERTDVVRNPELDNTFAFNYYGIPTITVPCGFTSAGLPIGLSIAGPRFAEGRVLALARAYEQATEWHLRRPPLTPDTPVPALAATDEDS
jgi:aspartyl-tRNA(Asn)/glutamyl-tRNA(Gln) amidotransferase subunit A